jgi:hypothetical protein
MSDANWIRNLFDARHKIAIWREDYSGARQHSSLAYRTPREFAAQWQCLRPRSIPYRGRNRPSRGYPDGALTGGLTNETRLQQTT